MVSSTHIISHGHLTALEVTFMKNKFGQMKIMQMSFMIVAVFIFFVLVGLFFLNIMFKDIGKSSEELSRDQAIASLEVISSMMELSYGDRETLVLDEDKLRVLLGQNGEEYGEFWPIASLEVYKVYPVFEKVVPCPALDCNYYNLYDSGQRNAQKFSSYVSICKRVRELGSVFDRCTIGKIVIGKKIFESEVGSR